MPSQIVAKVAGSYHLLVRSADAARIRLHDAANFVSITLGDRCEQVATHDIAGQFVSMTNGTAILPRDAAFTSVISKCLGAQIL